MLCLNIQIRTFQKAYFHMRFQIQHRKEGYLLLHAAHVVMPYIGEPLYYHTLCSLHKNRFSPSTLDSNLELLNALFPLAFQKRKKKRKTCFILNRKCVNPRDDQILFHDQPYNSHTTVFHHAQESSCKTKRNRNPNKLCFQQIHQHRTSN